jgi:cyclophilin family peptidyl-prolyl cis-trans isomerase
VLAACGTDTDTTGDSDDVPATTAGSDAAPATTLEVPEITLPPSPPSDYIGFAAQTTACGADAPAPLTAMRFAAPEDQGLDPGVLIEATISTSCGDIVIALDPGIAPETVNSFVFLARSGYFDGSVSHRIVPGFVIQAGDPTATGREGPGYTIIDELPEPGFVYERGTLAMANAGPNTTGSQFFIVLANAPLGPDFTVFGQVTDGFEVLDLISSLPLGRNAFGEESVPLETLYLESVTIAG